MGLQRRHQDVDRGLVRQLVVGEHVVLTFGFAEVVGRLADERREFRPENGRLDEVVLGFAASMLHGDRNLTF